MEKKIRDEKDTFDNQENAANSNIPENENITITPDDSISLFEEETTQDEENELDFSKFENQAFVDELNQEEEDNQDSDPLEAQDNPYLDDQDFDDPDLDVPGSDMDNEMEDIGSEDEENNYYSLGGDRHEDLEEQHFDEDL